MRRPIPCPIPCLALCPALCAALLAAVVLLPAAAAATAPPAPLPDLSGTWTYSFTTEEGDTFADTAVIRQEGGDLTGHVSYEQDGRPVEDRLQGRVHADGSVVFTLEEDSGQVHHRGQLGPEGNTISGSWSGGGGEGVFSLTRDPGEVPDAARDIAGQWIYSFENDEGESYSDPAVIRQDGDRFDGEVTYSRNGQEVSEPFDGVIRPDGEVEFTLYDTGQAITHKGRFSPDGQRITGTWSFPEGHGTFTLARPDAAGPERLPDLEGAWTYTFTTGDGASFSDPADLLQDGEWISGRVRYTEDDREQTEPFDGVVRPDGSVEFTLYTKEYPVEHWGLASSDGNSIEGQWSYAEGSGTFVMTRRHEP